MGGTVAVTASLLFETNHREEIRFLTLWRLLAMTKKGHTRLFPRPDPLLDFPLPELSGNMRIWKNQQSTVTKACTDLLSLANRAFSTLQQMIFPWTVGVSKNNSNWGEDVILYVNSFLAQNPIHPSNCTSIYSYGISCTNPELRRVDFERVMSPSMRSFYKLQDSPQVKFFHSQRER